MLRQEMAYFDLRTSGSLADRLAHEAPQIKAFAGESFGGLVSMVVTVVVAIAIAMQASWQLTLTLMVFVPLMGLGQMLKIKSMKKKDETRAGPLVSEVMGNMRTVAAFGLQSQMLRKYTEILEMEVQ